MKLQFHYVWEGTQNITKTRRNKFAIDSPLHIPVTRKYYAPWLMKQVVLVQFHNHQLELGVLLLYLTLYHWGMSKS